MEEEEILEMEEKVRLARERLKKKREIEDEEENQDDGNQTGANLILITFIVIVGYKIMTGTF